MFEKSPKSLMMLKFVRMVKAYMFHSNLISTSCHLPLMDRLILSSLFSYKGERRLQRF